MVTVRSMCYAKASHRSGEFLHRCHACRLAAQLQLLEGLGLGALFIRPHLCGAPYVGDEHGRGHAARKRVGVGGVTV